MTGQLNHGERTAIERMNAFSSPQSHSTSGCAQLQQKVWRPAPITEKGSLYCTLSRIFHQNDEGWVMTRRILSQCRSVNRSSRWWFAELKGRCRCICMLDKEKKQSITIVHKITTVLLPRGVTLALPRELPNVTSGKKLSS